MPYIKGSDRRRYCARQIDTFENPGQLNFAFTDLINFYIKDKGLSYQTINDVVGALTCCKDEFYRRIAVPYEQKKIRENGDAYDLKEGE
jgi:hypothetical protein